jgi:hypothetical protein
MQENQTERDNVPDSTAENSEILEVIFEGRIFVALCSITREVQNHV